MELVYLWVEDYKNIKKQGFNFSPRFEFDYNEDTNELIKIRDDSKTYKSIFPKNINITSIVGENGSGKSRIVEIISSILTDRITDKTKYFYILNNGIDNLIYSNNIEVKSILISENNIPLCLRNKKMYSNINNKIYLSNYFNMYYLNISHLERDAIIKYDVPSPEEPINYLGIYEKNDLASSRVTEETIYPTFTEFKLSQFNFFQVYAISSLLIEEKYQKLFFKTFKIEKPHFIKINYIKENLERIKIINTPSSDKEQLVDKTIPKKVDALLNFLSHIDNKLIIGSSNLELFFKLSGSIYNLEKEFKLEFLTEDEETIYFSSGEKTIFFYLQKIDLMIDEILKNPDKPNILLFDEVELYLHPNWQKRILKIVIDFIEQNKLKKLIHIIITSHSPFILSDLPKENVIFLEKGEQKYPFKDKQTFGANIHTLLSDGFFMDGGLMGEFAKGKIEEIKKFYELVKKCEKVINESEKVKSIIKNIYLGYEVNFRHIQSIIGEPFLQTVIKNYLDELDILFNGKNNFLDNEIKRLQALKDK